MAAVVRRDNGKPLARLVKDPLYWYQVPMPLAAGHLLNQHFVRQGVLRKLHKVSRGLSVALKRRYGLFIFETYVPAEVLRTMRRILPLQLGLRYGDLSEDDRQTLLDTLVAPPADSPAVCGASLGVTLFDRKERSVLWFGTRPQEILMGGLPELDELAGEHKDLYDTLCGLFADQGFVRSPIKWWLFTHGDALWAAQTGAKETLYRPVAYQPTMLLRR